MSAANARFFSRTLAAALLCASLLAAPGCEDPDVVLSTDKLVLSFTRGEFVRRNVPCDDPDVPAGSCATGETSVDELHLAGAPVRKTVTISNNASTAFTLTGAFVGPEGEALDGAPFRLVNPDPSADQEPSVTVPELTINANSDLELTIYFYGEQLGINNARLRLVTQTTETVTDADGNETEEPSWVELIVLQGTVDCVSLGWDQDRDGYCASDTMLPTDPQLDCDDSTGPGFRANPGIEEESCEYDANGDLDAQVDNDCDGFVANPVDQDEDGVCSFAASCVVAGDTAAEEELALLCGAVADDCNDDPTLDANAPFVTPGRSEICEIGPIDLQVDNNCDPSDDLLGLRLYLRDQDGDGFGQEPSAEIPGNDAANGDIEYCGDPSGALGALFSQCREDPANPGSCLYDCNDGIATINPDAEELCDGDDTDCDGVLGDASNLPLPPNPPPFFDPSTMLVDVDADNDGRPLCSGLDCDDTNNDVSVGAAELCDGVDNNCDTLVPPDELDDDGDGYGECVGLPPTAQIQVAGQPAQELTLFAAPALDVLDALQIVVTVQAGLVTSIVEDVGALTVTLTYQEGVDSTTSLRAFVTNEIQVVGSLQLIGLAIGSGEHLWTATDEDQVLPITGTLGGDCNDDPSDPAAPAINPGASELNGAGFAICDGQDNDCDGIGHPNETDDDQDSYAECSPSADIAGPGAGEGITLRAPPSAAGENIDVVFVDGGSEGVTEDASGRSVTVTFVDGTSTTDSLVSTISGAGLTLISTVTGAGSTPWAAAQAGNFVAVSIPGGDCNDTNPEIFLGATELCDGFDDDCDGAVPAVELDGDGDGFVTCTPDSVWLAGVVAGAAGGDDCEDDVLAQPFASLIYPGAPEIADSYYDAVAGVYVLVDNQCPGDAGYDADGVPGVGEYCTAPLTSAASCVGSSSVSCYSCPASELDLDGDNISPAAGDCDDTNPQVNNQLLELCDGFDNNCDGVVPASELDVDGDGYIICNVAPGVTTAPGIVGGSDCNDGNGVVNPGEAEIADGLDNDCDPATVVPEEEDDDGDGVSELEGDCDDFEPTVWEDTAAGTSAPEICDELDNDCDGLLSDGSGASIDELDDDGDGFTVCDPSQPTNASVVNDCLEHASQITAAFPGYPLFGADNYPANAAAVHPTAPEVCDGWDTDCSSGGFVTSTSVEPLEFDHDGDAFVDCFDTAEGLAGWTEFAAQANRALQGANDCADVQSDTANVANPGGTSTPLTSIYPGATDTCDGWDNDCNGASPPFVAVNSDEFDDDGDRYLECGSVTVASGAVNNAGQSILGGYDCLDDPSTDPELSGGNHPQTGAAVTSAMAASVNPGASEVCDGWNTDCAAGGPTVLVLPSLSDIPGEVDQDVDDYIECTTFVSATGAPGFAGGDCLDVTLASNAYSDNVNPAATEVCDSWDTDCSSQPAYPANDGLPELAQEIDDDGDDYIQCDFAAAAVSGGAVGNGYGGVTNGSDCLDVTLASNAYSDNVNPAATEVCDSWDTDCSAQPAYPANDGAPELAQEIDDDADTYIQCDFAAAAISGGAVGNGYGTVINGSDCLDVALAGNGYSDDVNPGASEVCDGWDTDCNSQPAYPSNIGTPENLDERDQDGDLYIQCAMVPAAAGNGPNNEVGGSDCLDVASNSYSDDVNPGNSGEVCDGWDTDCDSQPAYPGNDGTPEAADELDDDGDGYVPCDMVAGAAGNGPNGESGSDCLDVASNSWSDDVNPGESSDVCDGWDTDCSNQPAYPANVGNPENADELDQDTDGYIQCDMVPGASGNGPGGVQGSDCLDVALASNQWSNDVNPGAASEVCDGWDTDCSNQPAYPSNVGTPEDTDERDQDADGFIQCDMVTGSEGRGPNGEFGSDCLDVTLGSNAYSDDVKPGAAEVCDGWDTDCDSQSSYPANDGTPEDELEIDDDADGYIECGSYVAGGQTGLVGGADCLDDPIGLGLLYPLDTAPDEPITVAMANAVNPGASELCDGFNTDCGGGNYLVVITPLSPTERDADSDDFVQCGPLESYAPAGIGALDCDDSVSSINPGVSPDDASENLVDNDCDGFYDEDAAGGAFAVTELMVDVSGGNSQWIELVNQAGRDVSLHGMVIADGTGGSFTFTGSGAIPTAPPGSLTIADTEYLVLCVDPTNGTDGTTPAQDCFNTAPMTGFELNEGADSVTLSLAGGTVDTLSWSSNLGLSGNASASLEPSLTPYDTNNNTVSLSLAAWCQASNNWSGGGGSRYGTPGYQNLSCDINLIDVDGDGYCAGGEDSTGDGDCDDPSENAVSNPTDCDETNPNVNEAAIEVCDGLDTDCSGTADFTNGGGDELDADGDNYVECTGFIANGGSFSGGSDCDDARAYMNAGQSEVCDGYDNDCAGGATFTGGGGDELDADGDDYLECSPFVNNDAGGGFLGGLDCDDVRPYKNPGATEVCDGYDNDCAGGVNFTNEVDVDSDQWFLCTGFVDQDGADAFDGGSDCDDARPYMNGGETEVCDGYDNDCSGTADFTDSSGDEDNGDSDAYIECDQANYVDQDGADGFDGGDDCNDAVATTYPGAPELCDAIDNDCSGVADDGLDGDGDGVTTCGPDGINGNTDDDCDDGNSAIFPGATEICDGYDSNCTGGGSPLPPDVATELDDDGDGYIECTVSGGPTLAPGITGGQDCLDATGNTYSDDVNPGETEVCDGFDTDCSAAGTPPANEVDDDSDGYIECSSYVVASTSGLTGGGDCRDVTLGTDAYSDDINPGEAEVCDGFDTDCSTGTYTNAPTNETDTDGDGYVACSSYVGASTSGLTGGDDCRDVSLGTDAYSDDINPGEAEVCDGFDTDCSTGTYTNAPTNETDADGDGYVACSSYVGTSTSGLTGGDDCRDVSLGTDAYSDDINPGESEVCDGFDTDCSTGTYTNAPANETDTDTDGYVACSGYVGASTSGLTGGDDCRDVALGSDAYSDDINPGEAEACDGFDTDCSTGTYTNAPSDETDTDTDGYVACSGYVGASTSGLTGGDDCRDVALGSDAYSDDINPGEAEVCDGFDTDCSTGTYTNAPADELDDDTDGYIECASYVVASTAVHTGGDDCDDGAPTINPGASELCDGRDTDCAGGVSASAPNETDADGDGYIACTFDATAVTNGDTTGDDGDCNDNVALIFPSVVLPDAPGSGTTLLACLDDDGDGLCLGGGVDGNADGDCQDDGEDYDSAKAVALGSEAWADCDDTSVFVDSSATEDAINGLDDDTDGVFDEDCFGEGGELIITELFAEDDTTGDLSSADDTDWIEVANNTWFEINVSGWTISDGSATSTLPATSVVLERFELAGGIAVLTDTASASGLGSVSLADWGGGSFVLDDIGTGADVQLLVGATAVDSVDYSAFTDPGNYNSYELDQGVQGQELPGDTFLFNSVTTTADVHNDTDGNWCAESTATWATVGTTDLKGTPGTLNTCP